MSFLHSKRLISHTRTIHSRGMMKNIRFKYSYTYDEPGHKKYPNLLSPVQLTPSVWMRNRVLMGSMHTGLEEKGNGLFGGGSLEKMAAFYAERAAGGVGMIVTGGIAPNLAGTTTIGGARMQSNSDVENHRVVTNAVHAEGGLISMQILHTGRYGYHPFVVSSSAKKSAIGWFTPHALSTAGVYKTIDDFVNCAEMAQKAGYDGVEVMGSEGYLINQFIAKRVNSRTDEFGGEYKNRIRFPLEIVRRIRKACGPDFVIIFRLSMLDLVENGSTWEEISELAGELRNAGVSILNTGIGWHEARIPTIATMVPRGGFAWVTERMAKERQEKNFKDLLLCTTNRINTPDVAEEIIASGMSDIVSMARPFLADPNFVSKTIQDKADTINTCIGCNQACLDHIFVHKRASCLVNPRAGFESEFIIRPVDSKNRQRVAVVGAGPAGLAAATTAASRGHSVTLFERDSEIGGQFNMAKRVPGKEEFYETIRYFNNLLTETGVDVRLNTNATAEDLADYDRVVLATGVIPRDIKLPVKTDRVKVHSYIDVLRNNAKVGKSVAIIGAGGIGFDVADFITHDSSHDDHGAGTSAGLEPGLDKSRIASFTSEWGIDTTITIPGALTASHPVKVNREVYLLQRKSGRPGSTLGKTTGWIHRSTIKRRGVKEMSGCKYIEVNDEGLVIEQGGKQMTLPVDTVILCAGQESLLDLKAGLESMNVPDYLIGGAQLAAELDAKRAIDQGTRLAANIENAPSGAVYNAPIDFTHKVYKFLVKK